MQERISVNLQTAAIKIIRSIECCPYRARKDMFPLESVCSHLIMKKQYKNATIRLIEMIEFAFFLFLSQSSTLGKDRLESLRYLLIFFSM